uniref:SEP domain-containing protein n=1 Tax=Haemonchus contortus TaxID=6289 RepID=A0A7I4YQ19_HAECO|nr:unnamed protein product [Haemonchus contortus]
MAAVASQRAKRRHFKTKRKAEDELRRQVGFNSDDNMEYHVPLDVYNQSPIPTLSSSSVSNDPRFLDEIALLKRGVITRDTPKHTYRRGLSAEDPNVGGIHDDKPITLAELNTRGLRIDKEHIIYGFPQSSYATANDGEFKPQGSGTSVLSEDSTRNTIRSFIISPKNVKEFSVGFPGENATLRISSLSRDGESYELSTGDDVCVLQQRPENVVLITWKN